MKTSTIIGAAVAAGMEEKWSDESIIEHIISNAKDDYNVAIRGLVKELIHQIKINHEYSIAAGKGKD